MHRKYKTVHVALQGKSDNVKSGDLAGPCRTLPDKPSDLLYESNAAEVSYLDNFERHLSYLDELHPVEHSYMQRRQMLWAY